MHENMVLVCSFYFFNKFKTIKIIQCHLSLLRLSNIFVIVILIIEINILKVNNGSNNQHLLCAHKEPH
jgi:hypothetical protein